MAQTAAALGVRITPQALDQRFTETAAACLEQVFAAAVAQVIAAAPIAVPILDRFEAVEVQDSTSITLPAALADVFFGCAEGSAGVKAHLGLKLRTGALRGPTISDGCTHDSTVTLPGRLPAASLHLTDLGYFGLTRFQALSDQQQFWLSRYKRGTIVWDADGVRWDHLMLSETMLVLELQLPHDVALVACPEPLQCQEVLLERREPVDTCRDRKAPAARGPYGQYSAYTATPTSVQTARYDPTKTGTARTRPLA